MCNLLPNLLACLAVLYKYSVRACALSTVDSASQHVWLRAPTRRERLGLQIVLDMSLCSVSAHVRLLSVHATLVCHGVLRGHVLLFRVVTTKNSAPC
jgi:hypothetical protein